MLLPAVPLSPSLTLTLTPIQSLPYDEVVQAVPSLRVWVRIIMHSHAGLLSYALCPESEGLG